ncbi:MAG: CHAT domain-containing protein [Pirellulaceae bacterium]
MDSYERNESSGSSDKSRWDQPRFQSWEQLFDAIFDRWEEIKAEYENGEAYRRIKKSSWEAKLIKRLKRTSHRHRYSTDEEAHKHLLLRLELRSKWSSEVKKTLSDKKLGNDVRGMHEQLQRLELFDSGEFPDWIRHELVKGITLALRQANRIKLDANEIAGLLGKDRRWRELACDESDYDSVFGKYGSDLIVTKNQSALIKTEIWSTRKQLQLWFHWKLIAVYEIACAQWLATEMMRQEMDRASSSSTPTSGFSDVSRRFNLLATTQRHLPPSFRKWYYCVSSSIGTDRRLAEVGSEQQRFDHGQLLRRLEMHDYKNEAIILFLGANPSDTTQLELPKEAQAIDDRLRNTELRDQFKIEQQWEPKAQQIPGKIMRFNPTIVHFSGHGSKCGNLVFVDEDNIAREADTESIAEIFRLINETVRCVVLNACYSNKQAAAIAEHVEIVIGMSQAIGDKDAIQFSSSFYEALGYGKSFQKAFELAKLGMKLSESDDALVPKMFHRDGIDPNDCFCF